MTTPDISKSPLKVFIYYAIGSLILFALVNCIGLIRSLSVQTLFFLILLSFLIAGIIHLFFIENILCRS